MELVLAVDVSLSVNDPEFALEMGGIAAAFRDKDIISLIEQHRDGVAVTMTHWSATYHASQPVPWRLLTDEASTLAFAEEVASTPRRQLGSFTALGKAIAFATELIETNEFDGDEKKIDVAGDGRNNTGPDPAVTRQAAVAHDITINGLAIVNDDPSLASYYTANVISGAASFVVVARDFESFAEAFKRKLKRELSPKVAYQPSALPVDEANAQ